jgi:serine/threonine-protein kinase RsbW
MVFIRSMTSEPRHVVRLQFTSVLEMVDLVQVVGDHVARLIGLDDDAVHWINVAVRESVINAIKHGNQGDRAKHVFVEFERSMVSGARELTIRVRDQGPGFDPSLLANPLAPENILKASGRGIFLIRNFMDDVRLEQAPGGGMEICMVKRIQSAGTHDAPVIA